MIRIHCPTNLSELTKSRKYDNNKFAYKIIIYTQFGTHFVFKNKSKDEKCVSQLPGAKNSIFWRRARGRTAQIRAVKGCVSLKPDLRHKLQANEK